MGRIKVKRNLINLNLVSIHPILLWVKTEMNLGFWQMFEYDIWMLSTVAYFLEFVMLLIMNVKRDVNKNELNANMGIWI